MRLFFARSESSPSHGESHQQPLTNVNFHFLDTASSRVDQFRTPPRGSAPPSSEKRVSIMPTSSISQLPTLASMRIVWGVENLCEPTVRMQGIPQRCRQLLLLLHGKDPGSPSVAASRSILFVHQAIVTKPASCGVPVSRPPDAPYIYVATTSLFH